MKTTLSNFYAKLLIVIIALAGVYFAEHIQKLYISAFFISAAFIGSFFMHRKTFPFILIGLACYWVAIMKDLWADYNYYDLLSRYLWTSGNVLMCIGVLYLFYEQFKSKTNESNTNSNH
ncbi:hypothetical protein I4P13_15775 [Elizabethkingia meningoseptica]|uniref:hypothetical protein n=1 Tax=Elizabethkingia TaxID=308865 RepID=UPI000750FF23|nr:MULTISPECIES: hypothetical protein [Elizabethkingia]KUY28006.1 hypothetical protein ATB96_19415 [Elizabethkingia ursingii]MBG0515226.1 hypothetical protein [Elizabethkingia meningoseptica]